MTGWFATYVVTMMLQRRQELEYENSKLRLEIARLESTILVLRSERKEAIESGSKALNENAVLKEQLEHAKATMREDLNELRARLRRETQIVDRLLDRDL